MAANDELLGPRHEYTVIHPVHALPRTVPSCVGTAAVHEFYKEEAAAVLDGSRGHGSLANLILGSVATKVLALCTTPVLLIR